MTILISEEFRLLEHEHEGNSKNVKTTHAISIHKDMNLKILVIVEECRTPSILIAFLLVCRVPY